MNGGGAELFSRRNLRYRQFVDLSSEMNADDAILEDEIVKLGESDRPVFIDLMRRWGPFQFVAFDVLALNGKDVRNLELAARKKLLRVNRADAIDHDLLCATRRRTRPRFLQSRL